MKLVGLIFAATAAIAASNTEVGDIADLVCVQTVDGAGSPPELGVGFSNTDLENFLGYANIADYQQAIGNLDTCGPDAVVFLTSGDYEFSITQNQSVVNTCVGTTVNPSTSAPSNGNGTAAPAITTSAAIMTTNSVYNLEEIIDCVCSNTNVRIDSICNADGQSTTTLNNTGQSTTTLNNNGQSTTTLNNNGQSTTTLNNNGQSTTTLNNNGESTTTEGPLIGAGSAALQACVAVVALLAATF